MFNYACFVPLGISTLGYKIALTVLGSHGYLVNLLFSSIWHFAFRRQHVNGFEEGSAANSVPLLEETSTDTQETMLDVESPSVKNPSTLSQQKKQVQYINNIKIFLTFVVILHHCVSDFGGWWPGLLSLSSNPMNWGVITLNIFMVTNASYFMNAFFFYSGFFVPISMDKKGLYKFCSDKMKRLGIPFVVYNFVIEPYVEYGFASLFLGISYPGAPTTGPTWFINQLMLLSLVYEIVCGIGWSPKISCPSLLGFLLIGAGIGFLTSILLLFFPAGDFFFAVPLFWQDYLSYPKK
jgi:hypothetical protein